MERFQRILRLKSLGGSWRKQQRRLDLGTKGWAKLGELESMERVWGVGWKEVYTPVGEGSLTRQSDGSEQKGTW